MTVELWLGDEFEHEHETSALSTFLQRMVDTYGQDQELYLILANFFVNANPIDLAVVKHRGIMVIELKEVGEEAGDVLTGSENGPWTITNPLGRHVQLRGGSHGNPFKQARTYRYALIDFLIANQQRFLKPKAGQVRLDQVSAFVALSPKVPALTRLELPELLWFKLVGLDRLHLTVFQKKSHDLTLQTTEMRRLVKDTLHLRQVPLEKYILVPAVAAPTPAPVIAAAKVTGSPPTSDLIVAEPVAAPVAPPRPDTVVGEPPAAPGAAPVSVPIIVEPPPPVTPVVCLSCAAGAAVCDVPFLGGAVVGVATNVLAIQTGEREPMTAKLADPWTPLAAQIERLLAAQPSIEVSLYHLRRDGDTLVAGPDSLVILEPNWLINVTDLTRVEYCQRQLLIDQFVSSPPNAAIVRGNVVHDLFEEVWKNATADLAEPRRKVVDTQLTSMAFADANPESVSAEVEPHLNHLQQWAGAQPHTTALRNETFVLAPAVGLKGRIDALWEKDGRPVILGELKTGKSQGADPRPGHRLQLLSYALMLFSRGELTLSELFAVLLYSGNQPLGAKGANVMRRVPLSLSAFRDTLQIRNDLVLIDYTGNGRFETNLNKCAPCSVRVECARLALLAGQVDTRSKPTQEWLPKGQATPGEAERRYFRHAARLLTAEVRTAKAAHVQLWRAPLAERVAAGKTMQVGRTVSMTRTATNRYQYVLEAAGQKNSSELRPGDNVLISGPDGPAAGRVAVGTVQEAKSAELTLVTADEVRFQPTWLDAYTDENLARRPLVGLYGWVTDPERQRQRDLLLREDLPPAFSDTVPAYNVPRVFGDRVPNEGQKLALAMSLRAQDYLLVLGPPGSGKTTLIEAVVRAHLALGQRVLIAAGTNRAIDEALSRLIRTEIGAQVLRLGNEASVSPELLPNTLVQLMQIPGSQGERVEAGRKALRERPVVGATISTLLSGGLDRTIGKFDLVIVDEAAQLTVPATLGAIRLARRFVLIGDNHQLPPVVQSEPGGRPDFLIGPAPLWEARLSRSLFDLLCARLEEQGWEGLVKLTDQYRMNQTICVVPSEMWYNGELRPADESIARRRLELASYSPAHPLHSILNPEEPVKFIDVPLDAGGTVRTNALEARWIRRLVRAYRSFGMQLGSESGPGQGQLAVIAPFRAQVALIRRELEEEFSQEGGHDLVRSTVDTVDRFQGSERDLIIISLASGTGAVHDLLRDPRRLNVAMTRARHKLIMLGNFAHLNQDPVFAELFEILDAHVGYANWRVAGTGSE